MSNSDNKPKKKWKLWQKILLIIGIIVLVLGIAAGAAFLYFRRTFGGNAPTVTIGEAVDEAVVETTGGLVRGYISNGIYTYHGIPYASAPERFVAAQPVQKWDGVRDVAEFGPISPQGSLLGMSGSADQTGTDNDCLNLNIWTKGTSDNGKRPVMVWYHGGGFSTGSGNDAMYDGEALALSEDVVVVTVNHRLNLFGYMDLSSYGDKYANGGNQGVTDMVASLEWIRDNIERFGGDPENVTIFGQSGGGAKVLALMTTPSAKGLFSKGIVQSGATDTMGLTFASKEASLALTENILSKLGISESNIEDIQTVSEAELQEAAGTALNEVGAQFEIPAPFGGYAMEWGPVVDGDYMPTNPVTEDGFADAGKDVTLLIGSNLNEWAMAGASPSDEDATDEVKAAFEAAYPNESVSEITRFDTLLRYPLLKITRHKAMQGGAGVYSYVYTYDDNPMGAYHTAEIQYVFNHADGDAMSKTLSQAWASFAREGVPSSDNLPEWESYTMETGAEMILDKESYVSYNHDLELLRLLNPGYDLD